MARHAAPHALLARYPSDVQELVEATRELMFAALPGVEETFDSRGGMIGYGFGPGYRGSVANLILSQQGVKIGVVRGTELEDPDGLMAGQGKVHRHVAIASRADLRRPALKKLLKSAHAAWKERRDG